MGADPIPWDVARQLALDGFDAGLQAALSDPDLRTTLAYEAGQIAERERVAAELRAISQKHYTDADFCTAVEQFIDKLEDKR